MNRQPEDIVEDEEAVVSRLHIEGLAEAMRRVVVRLHAETFQLQAKYFCSNLRSKVLFTEIKVHAY